MRDDMTHDICIQHGSSSWCFTDSCAAVVTGFCLRPTAKLSAEGLGITFCPHTHRHYWNEIISCKLVLHVLKCDMVWQCFTLLDNCWQLFWQLFDNFLTTFDNFLTTFSQKKWHFFRQFVHNFFTIFWLYFDHSFLTNFVTLHYCLWHTLCHQKPLNSLDLSIDSRRHGRGTYLFN
jgi:hypothetical protein